MIIVATIDNLGNGHHGAFDAKFLTVLSKVFILCTPDTTNMHSKHRIAVTVGAVRVSRERMVFCFTQIFSFWSLESVYE